MVESGTGKGKKKVDSSDRGGSDVIGANRPDFSGMAYAKKEKSQEASVQQVENADLVKDKPVPAVPKKGIFGRFWAHYKRRWCWYTLGGVIFLAIMLPVFFLVVFPAIAQKLVDDADLPIWSARIMHPTPTSVEYSLVASLKVPPPFTVKLDPLTLNLFVKGDTSDVEPYIKVGLPEYNLRGNTTIAIENQTAAILDKPIFESFLRDAVYSEYFELSASGASNAHLGALKAHIHMDKTIKMKGLNQLKGFGIQTARAVLPPEADGSNLLANLTIPNASIVTFELGNVTLNLIMGGLILGNATIFDVLLEPGNNTVAARGFVDLKLALQNLPTIIKSQIDPLKSLNLELSASGNSTIYNGKHIDYYEKILNNLTLTTQISVLSILGDTLGGLLGTSGLGSLLGGSGSGSSGLNLTSILGSLDITSLLSNLTSLAGL